MSSRIQAPLADKSPSREAVLSHVRKFQVADELRDFLGSVRDYGEFGVAYSLNAREFTSEAFGDFYIRHHVKKELASENSQELDGTAERALEMT